MEEGGGRGLGSGSRTGHLPCSVTRFRLLSPEPRAGLLRGSDDPHPGQTCFQANHTEAHNVRVSMQIPVPTQRLMLQQRPPPLSHAKAVADGNTTIRIDKATSFRSHSRTTITATSTSTSTTPKHRQCFARAALRTWTASRLLCSAATYKGVDPAHGRWGASTFVRKRFTRQHAQERGRLLQGRAHAKRGGAHDWEVLGDPVPPPPPRPPEHAVLDTNSST